MAIIDPTYLSRERNHFPDLTDAEFEALSIYCQTLSYRDTASFRGTRELQTRRLIASAREKLCVSNDSHLVMSFLLPIVDKNHFPDVINDDQSSLLCLYALTGNQKIVSSISNQSKEEINFQLIQIKNALKVEDIYAARMLFLVKILFLT